MARFTATQGRYLAYIHCYAALHGFPPSEAEIAQAMCVSPPSVNQMIKNLERRGLILRQPGVPRSVRILIPEEEIPTWHRSGTTQAKTQYKQAAIPMADHPTSPPANLFVLSVILVGGPIARKYANKETSRVIEIRGDQTLHQLHGAIFSAYDRWDDHLYEFQLGKRPFDPEGPNYSLQIRKERGKNNGGDAKTTKLDDLNLQPERVFGYWFDFGDDWYHQIQVERVETAIVTVAYPRVIRRKGKSPPQYPDE